MAINSWTFESVSGPFNLVNFTLVRAVAGVSLVITPMDHVMLS